MDNCTYDLVKLLHQMSLLNAYVDRHAKKNARSQCKKNLAAFQKDLKKHMKVLHADLAKRKLK